MAKYKRLAQSLVIHSAGIPCKIDHKKNSHRETVLGLFTVQSLKTVLEDQEFHAPKPLVTFLESDLNTPLQEGDEILIKGKKYQITNILNIDGVLECELTQMS